jgi:hypothetical protein
LVPTTSSRCGTLAKFPGICARHGSARITTALIKAAIVGNRRIGPHSKTSHPWLFLYYEWSRNHDGKLSGVCL